MTNPELLTMFAAQLELMATDPTLTRHESIQMETRAARYRQLQIELLCDFPEPLYQSAKEILTASPFYALPENEEPAPVRRPEAERKPIVGIVGWIIISYAVLIVGLIWWGTR